MYSQKVNICSKPIGQSNTNLVCSIDYVDNCIYLWRMISTFYFFQPVQQLLSLEQSYETLQGKILSRVSGENWEMKVTEIVGFNCRKNPVTLKIQSFNKIIVFFDLFFVVSLQNIKLKLWLCNCSSPNITARGMLIQKCNILNVQMVMNVQYSPEEDNNFPISYWVPQK